MMDEELDSLVRHVMRSNLPDDTLFPFASVKMLKAFRYWLHLQDHIGNVHDDYAFERGEAFVTLDRIKKASKDLAPAKPKAFKNMVSSWTTWKEQWLTYLLQLRGVALIHLAYLCCNLDEPTDNM